MKRKKREPTTFGPTSRGPTPLNSSTTLALELLTHIRRDPLSLSCGPHCLDPSPTLRPTHIRSQGCCDTLTWHE